MPDPSPRTTLATQDPRPFTSNPDARARPRILFAPAREHTEKVFAPEVMARMEAVFDLDRNHRDTDLSEDEVQERIAGCHGLVTGWGVSDPRVLRPRSAMALTPAIMEAADRLRIIAHAAGSVRQMLGAVWQDYIAARGICVFTATVEIGYNVAETAVGLMIMSAKRLMEYALHVRDTGGWRSPGIPVDEQHLFGATVGIVGASDVGRRVMLLLRPFDVRLLVFDPYLDAQEAGALHAEKVELDELFTRADIVSLHAPSIPETRHMVGAPQLRRLRDGALLVNTARGSLIDQEALIREAGTGRIRVALDVTTPEPLPADSPLRTMSNVIITPHLAGQGRYGHTRIGHATAHALENFFAGRPVSGAITHARWDRLA